jgi:hypothetical protein
MASQAQATELMRQLTAAATGTRQSTTETQQPQPGPHPEYPTPDTAPPPYNHLDSLSDAEEDSDDEDEEEDPVPTTTPTPLKLKINARSQIKGSGNILPTSPSQMADANRFAALLVHTMNGINRTANLGRGATGAVKLEVTIDCGITVIGDKNIIGPIRVNGKQGPLVGGNGNPIAAAVAGAKRKADAVSSMLS